MEYITANGVEYAAKSVTTSINAISFKVEGKTANEAKTAFQPVTALTVSGEDKVVYGIYNNLSYESVTEYVDGEVEVTMHIKSTTEVRLDELERSQAEQDEVIAEMLGGGENMANIYAALIIKVKKSINDVPEKIRDEVKQVLIDEGHPELAEGDN